MKEYRVNLIDGIKPVESKEVAVEPMAILKPHKIGRFFFRLSVILLVIIIFFSANTMFSSQGLLTNFGRLSFWEGMARLALGKDKILKGELSDRINLVILGMGGAEHEGPYLTDTILIASLKPSTKDLAVFSVPRDLYAPTPDFGWQKINAVNSLGMIRSNDGAALVSKTIQDIFETPIHYWIRLDFSAFKEFIDWLGGVEIDVERSFVDYQFPAANYQFRSVSFEAGRQTMNGERALQFARSRHGTNNESTDFARMKRQQKIILAIKEKMEKENLIASPPKLLEIYNIFRDKISTNLDLAETVRLAKIAGPTKTEQIKTYAFGAELLNAETAINGAYILRPRTGNFKEMANLIKNAFSEAKNIAIVQNQIASPAVNPIVSNNPKLIILNGTSIAGLAQRTKTELETIGYQVLKIGNAPNRGYQKTVIYYSEGADANKIESLKQELTADALVLPENLKYLNTPETDFLIILGIK